MLSALRSGVASVTKNNTYRYCKKSVIQEKQLNRQNQAKTEIYGNTRKVNLLNSTIYWDTAILQNYCKMEENADVNVQLFFLYHKFLQYLYVLLFVTRVTPERRIIVSLIYANVYSSNTYVVGNVEELR